MYLCSTLDHQLHVLRAPSQGEGSTLCPDIEDFSPPSCPQDETQRMLNLPPPGEWKLTFTALSAQRPSALLCTPSPAQTKGPWE